MAHALILGSMQHLDLQHNPIVQAIPAVPGRRVMRGLARSIGVIFRDGPTVFATWREVSNKNLREQYSHALHGEGLARHIQLGGGLIAALLFHHSGMFDLLQDQSPGHQNGHDTINACRLTWFSYKTCAEHIPHISLVDGDGCSVHCALLAGSR